MNKKGLRKLLREAILLEISRKEAAKLGFEAEGDPKKKLDPEKRNLNLNYDFEEDHPKPSSYTDDTVIDRLEKIQRNLASSADLKGYVPLLEKILDAIEAQDDIAAYKIFRKIFNESPPLQGVLFPYYSYIVDRIEEEGSAHHLNESDDVMDSEYFKLKRGNTIEVSVLKDGRVAIKDDFGFVHFDSIEEAMAAEKRNPEVVRWLKKFVWHQ